ncbi:polysaccharide deacetylase family protein [Rhodococcus sp. IEGM 1381]|uniref:polysaccharide deacetylase family protein n=1 Tax=Rhodococcus sp. IEGM 1381 TaxID=3047085 RepID=UPI0024B68488|nr:polysaccharide deacetylase family protein [Rhodococcus sp. IEGM 1381]MDI9897378.1 polysaccharide deacetylase family protein [Rhodococcus sp. IEGM 1381]
MNNPIYTYSAIVDRPKMRLPDGKRIAVWFGLNIEHYEYGKPALSLAPFTAGLTPDPTNAGWRDYGPRVGFWRMLEVFDRLKIRPTPIVNSEVAEHYPAIVAAGVERGWTWVAHGKTNSTWQAGMSLDEERQYITEVSDELERATGSRPKGWLGPSLTASPNTNQLLAELGYTYNLDWGIDDQPFDLDVAGQRLLSVPYSTEVNDIPSYVLHGHTGPEFKQTVIDQFDQMRSEGDEWPRVFGLGLHPFLSGQPNRTRYFAEALEHMSSFDDVWFATADEIATWYSKETT